MSDTFYCVLAVTMFEDVTASGWPVTMGKDGPFGFLPVFRTREAAQAWAPDREIVMIRPKVPAVQS